MVNLPNVLTVFRLLLVPLLVAVLLTRFEGWEWVGLGVFLVASITDFLDGFLARRRKEITALGKILDPAADKILTSSAFISLVEIGLAPAWMVVIIVAREFAVTTLRTFSATQKVMIPSGLSGKVKTATQMIAISLLIIYHQLGEFRHVATYFLWAALIASVYSGSEYFIRYARVYLRQEDPLAAELRGPEPEETRP
jgi:CDP-diacylglycerol--glycerol-3-phosphate 3-phosphatidyltransferase